ncbi:MAG: FecCD family ABC transporter permease [Bacteroidota bacterium]
MLLISLLLLALAWGSGGWYTVLPEDQAQLLLLEFRLPAAVMALLAGAGLALAGLLMQTAFRNPLAGPYVLGISSGSSLGVALVVLAGFWFDGGSDLPLPMRSLAAMAGAFAMMLLNLSAMKLLQTPATLLVFGILLGHFIGAFTELLQYTSGGESLKRYLLWGMGTLQVAGWLPQALCALGVVLALLWALPRAAAMDVYALGDVYARSMGLSVLAFRRSMLLLAAVLAGLITAVCGPLSFVGLIIPHAARLLAGTGKHQRLLPYTVLCGMLFMLLVHVLSGLSWLGSQLPVNIVCSILGAPLIGWLLFRLRARF